jgi:hypothetical protein
MLNTRRTGSACQSNTASSVSSNSWVLSIVGITCARTLGLVGGTESIMKMYVIIVLCIYILFHHFFIAYLLFLLH